MIRLDLPLPVSKNARHTAIKCGRFFKTVRTKEARLKEEAMVALIWKQIGGRPSTPIFTRPCRLTYFLTFPDRRERDRQNYEESLCDCLERAGIVRNDSLLVHAVGEVSPEFKRPGGVVVTVEELP